MMAAGKLQKKSCFTIVANPIDNIRFFEQDIVGSGETVPKQCRFAGSPWTG